MTAEFDVTRYQDPLDIQRALLGAKTVAVVGLSANSLRASNFVGFYLQRHGYKVIPVNPREDEILGEKSYASLLDIPEPVDIVNVFRTPTPCRVSRRTRSRSAQRCSGVSST